MFIYIIHESSFYEIFYFSVGGFNTTSTRGTMFHNKKRSYFFFQHVDSDCNLLLTLQSPYTPTNFWQFCFSHSVLSQPEFGFIHQKNYCDKGEFTTLPNLIEIRQQYQTSNDLTSSVLEKSSTKKMVSKTQSSNTEVASNTLLDIPSRWDIYRENPSETLCETEESEKVLRNYLFSM